MILSESMKDLIVEELKAPNASHSRIAKRLGISERLVCDVGVNFGGLFSQGNTSLDRYKIAERHIDRAWPMNDVIDRAKAAYDLGEVEIVTGRQGFIQTLYAIPRKVKAAGRTPYFSRKFGDES